jgi:arachidonate 15-lipoxygenase
MSRAAAHPTLPQNDGPDRQAQRLAQLATARQTYAWTTTVKTLPGVPLATSVPSSDTPTIPWFARVIKVGLAVVRNLIAVKLSGAGTSQAASMASLMAAPGGVAAFTAATPETADLNRALAQCDRIEETVDGIVAQTSLARARGADALAGPIGNASLAAFDPGDDAVARLKAQADDLLGLAASHALGATPVTSLSQYEALFKTLALPAIASTFQTDGTFADLRVAGPNPMLLTGIDRLPANFPVTAQQYQTAMGGGDTLAAALAEGRAYLIDYAALDTLVPAPSKFSYVPLALFAVAPGGTSLKPVAIQCGQDPARDPIFTPASDGPGLWGWQMAKTVVQVAEGNYHELFVHLARTHLVMEAIAVATRRHLADVHPVWALLIPHCEGSLFINNAAAQTLIAEGGPIDQIFAGTIDSTQRAAAADRLAFDFYGKMLPTDLAARRVDDPAKLPDYPYRDDALLVWGALRDWATQYIGIYYPSDADVTGDFELSAWATALATDGRLRGFKPITTRAQLVDVCTMAMFTASAQHAAVNFPQQDDMTYAPAISGAGWTAAPTAQTGHTKSEWLGYLPPVPLAMSQLNTLYLLGSVHYRMLGDYTSNSLPYLPWFRDPAVTDNALPSFKTALAAVESAIVQRNGQRQREYTYLLPSLIPTSINI